MSHVFISYSRRDREYARRLVDKLLSEGFDVWIDDRINFNEDWELTIFDAIDTCSAFLVIMTPDSYTSKWVRRECHYAEKRDKAEFPVLLEGEEFPRYGITQYTDARDGGLPSESFFARLAEFAPRRESRGHEVLKSPVPEDDTDSIQSHVTGLLPSPFGWCAVPEGNVVIANAQSSNPAGSEGGTYSVPRFFIAKYPVTNAQYQVFLNATDGYSEVKWWSYSPDAEVWRKKIDSAPVSAFQDDNLPRTRVNWYETIAFCLWLSRKAGQEIFLPTEQQWQRAAQGDDGRAYPWGDWFSADNCNTEDSRIRQPTPVTKYSSGQSPFGVMDMSGNVAEWCLNEWGTDRVELSGTHHRALRGGSWSSSPSIARSFIRSRSQPWIRNADIGFRLVLIIHDLP